ncbi:MAG: L-2-hydroxyglutarate oxidase [Prolixibacteraceae bacterium]|jgi:L-2-hydroxyglutarate oxidase LhgO|nr:L-2-hydroxyglutarate oxidase [Prolixibacteraceae bacterium]
MKYDFLIVGAGIIGLSIARELREIYPAAKIKVLEKEPDTGFHSSGRNSGVLHAGFYYTADSLKAKFTKEGNRQLTEYCLENNLRINRCGKLVIAQNESELETLYELEKRGKANKVDVRLLNQEEAKEIDPNAKTFKKALYSPTTSTVDPIELCRFIKSELKKKNVEFSFGESYVRRISDNKIITSKGIEHDAGKLINTAGLYADRIAREFGFSKDYEIIPFKGLYLKYSKSDMPVKTNIYPVPNLKNPFLGVHFTITSDNHIKIGPTSMPAFWRENYKGFDNFSLSEFLNIISWEAQLFLTNAFGFRDLAIEEVKKYQRKYFIGLAKKMVYNIDEKGFKEWTTPGIRAQLLNINTKELVQDFVVEGDKESIHVLNAVSPAFTSSFPFSRWVVENFIVK